MAELTIDMTYGNALFQAARELKKTDMLLREGHDVVELFRREKEFFRVFNDPTISANKKKQILINVFQDRISTEMLNLLLVLVDKGRTKHYPRIIDAFQRLVDQEAGYAKGIIYSAVPLADEKVRKIEEQTKKLLREQVKLEAEIDSSLIGGIKILIDGKMIDASLKKRLDDLGNALL